MFVLESESEFVQFRTSKMPNQSFFQPRNVVLETISFAKAGGCCGNALRITLRFSAGQSENRSLVLIGKEIRLHTVGVSWIMLAWIASPFLKPFLTEPWLWEKDGKRGNGSKWQVIICSCFNEKVTSDFRRRRDNIHDCHHKSARAFLGMTHVCMHCARGRRGCGSLITAIGISFIDYFVWNAIGDRSILQVTTSGEVSAINMSFPIAVGPEVLKLY